MSKRLMREQEDLINEPSIHGDLRPMSKDRLTWFGYINGPQNTSYEGGRFLIMITVKDFPFKAPKVYMLSPLLHTNGQHLCCHKVESYWVPTHRISIILQKLRSWIGKPKQDHDLSKQWIERKEECEELARIWTRDYAQ